MSAKRSYDVFISHASEDKTAFVEPLALELRKRGLNVWFDKFELRVGDSLRESIERGLATSRFGIVVFSPHFLRKKWPKKELNGLFSREISGRKNRILPILHDLSFSKIAKRFPIQADKFSLSSALPISEICDSLLAVVKPELLKVGELKRQSFDCSEAFIEAARKEHPGYDFSVAVNPVGESGVFKKSVQVRMVNPAAMKSPPIVHVQFSGNEARKANDFIRTGKSQTWTVGEQASLTSEIPFFPRLNDGAQFSIVAEVNPNTRPVRVECGEGRFDYLLMKLIRRGSEEVEFEISSDKDPIRMLIVWPHSNARKRLGLTCSWQTSGYSPRRCLQLMHFVDGLMQKQEIRVIDITGENQEVVSLPPVLIKTKNDPFGPETRRLISLGSQIESYFGVNLILPTEMSENDAEFLNVLNGLLNGAGTDADVSGSAVLIKGENLLIDGHVCGTGVSNMEIFCPVDNYKGYIELFGQRIRVPRWGLAAKCHFDMADQDRLAYCQAAPGFELAVRLRNFGLCHFRWPSDPEMPRK